MATAARQIYWANALFTEADRRFNAHCATRLREAGYDVFLPQEAGVNEEVTPAAEEIFWVDTAGILRSQVLVACLDQETIDSGVACEVGLAYAFGIPTIGLYTDIRQHRRGAGRMYKNLYVVGCIEAIGEVVTNIDELLHALSNVLWARPVQARQHVDEQTVAQHFDTISCSYGDFVTRLESWYEPPWNATDVADSWLEVAKPERVLEVGCGTGDLGLHICRTHPAVSYLGYDISPGMVTMAQRSCPSDRCTYTSRIGEVVDRAERAPFDLAVAFFTLHDHPERESAIAFLARCVRPGGYILLVDLSTQDLPRLTEALRRDFARPIAVPDPRIHPGWLANVARETGIDMSDCKLALPKITFPSAPDLEMYLEVFGIHSGMDLPLGFGPGDEPTWRARTRRVLAGWRFPFVDQRVFIICALKRPPAP